MRRFSIGFIALAAFGLLSAPAARAQAPAAKAAAPAAADAKPAQTKPAEAKAADAKPEDAKAAEGKVAEGKAAEGKAAEAKPGESADGIRRTGNTKAGGQDQVFRAGMRPFVAPQPPKPVSQTVAAEVVPSVPLPVLGANEVSAAATPAFKRLN